MAVTCTLGRPIYDPGSPHFCEWSRLVWDLLGDYQPVVMDGYGRQNRVNVSQTLTFLSATSSWGAPLASDFSDEAVMRREPSISVVQVNVWSQDWEFGPEEDRRDGDARQ